jgi:MYXO-CTERM domain-containing protein
MVAQASGAGATTLTVVDATSFPPTGVLEIVVDPNDPHSVMRVGYSKSNQSNVLYLDAPLMRSVPPGATVRSAGAPTMVYENVGQGAGCAISPGPESAGPAAIWIGLVAALVALGRRRR